MIAWIMPRVLRTGLVDASGSTSDFRANLVNSPSTQTILRNQQLFTCKFRKEISNSVKLLLNQHSNAPEKLKTTAVLLDDLSDVQFAACRFRDSTQVCSREHPDAGLFHGLHAKAIARKTFVIRI